MNNKKREPQKRVIQSADELSTGRNRRTKAAPEKKKYNIPKKWLQGIEEEGEELAG